MTTCADVIARAYAALGVVGLGETSEAEESAYAMPALQSLFDTWVANGMFGRLTDVYKTSAYTAKEGERVHTSGSPTITIPTTYAYDGTIGADRPPYDLSLIEVQDGNTRNRWLYDRSAWVDIAGLATSDTCPLAERGLHGLACCLADLIAGPTRGQLTPEDKAAAFSFKQALSYKTGSARPPRTAEYF